MSNGLVEGRECGTCTACCTALTIDEPELQKLPGYTCLNCRLGAGCAIYETRPNLCREWYCAWRRLDWIAETLRPDRSGVLIIPLRQDIPPECTAGFGLDFLVLNHAALQAEGLPEALAKSVGDNIATFLSVPRDQGHRSIRAFLNEDLNDDVARGQLSAVRRHFKMLYTTLKFLGEADPGQPITIRNRVAPDGSA
jgi:hypothetical protein